jgi:hypothetical protein
MLAVKETGKGKSKELAPGSEGTKGKDRAGQRYKRLLDARAVRQDTSWDPSTLSTITQV